MIICISNMIYFWVAFFAFFTICFETHSARISRYSGEFGLYLVAPSGSKSLLLLFLFWTLVGVCEARTWIIILQCITVQHSTESTCPIGSLSVIGSEASFRTSHAWYGALLGCVYLSLPSVMVCLQIFKYYYFMLSLVYLY